MEREVSLISDFFEEDCNTLRVQWETTLKSELKIDQIESKTTKKTMESGLWPTLSLESLTPSHLPSLTAWKKSAQTYTKISTDKLASLIQEDLDAGVRSFFFPQSLDKKAEAIIQATIQHFSDHQDVDVFILGRNVLTAEEVHAQGGKNIQELALLAAKLIENLGNENVQLGVYVDGQFFKNIAKIRALKLLVQKILTEAGSHQKVSVIALTSLREWTLYERYSNLLRNDTAVASAYIAGADSIQSTGYQTLFDLEFPDLVDDEHSERSRRMARNTSHILALESMLGIVQDAAYGSYHLESLSENYASEAWTLMQKILPLEPTQRKIFLDHEIKPVREARLELVKTRKHILAGMNDFPNAKEKLEIKKLPQGSFFRVSREFENLRLMMENSSTKPRVFIALYGDYALLSARINFVKNYFEILGLEVNDPAHTKHDYETFAQELKTRQEEIVVICSTDDEYALIAPQLATLKQTEKFVAGKVSVPGFESLYAGQNVYQVLEGIVSRWGSK
jgi:methylmalonyl-CoA mutase